MASGDSVISLAVVLVDFTPREKYKTDSLLIPEFKDGITKAIFDNLMFSTDFYWKGTPIAPIDTTPHPDNEEISGSFRDYYHHQSLGKLDIVGAGPDGRSIINPDSAGSGLPLWVVLDSSIVYYDTNYTSTELKNYAKGIAETQLGVDLDQYDVICFIYAGEVLNQGTAPQSIGNMFNVNEVRSNKFAHIGVPVHEFAHAGLGAADEYKGNINPRYWCVMGYGVYNGRFNHGECPAPFAAPYRVKYGWVDPIVINTDTTNLTIYYNRQSPNFYKINIPASSEYFLVERRRKDDFDLYTPVLEDTAHGLAPQGILIWHAAPDRMQSNDFVEIQYADNDYDRYDDRFPYPNGSIQNFNFASSPSSKKRNGEDSFVYINNIDWVTDHGEIDVVFNTLRISSNTVWDESFDLDKPVFIENGAELTIGSGVTIEVDGNTNSNIKFFVEDSSKLIFSGTESDSIYLFSNGDPWGGIVLEENGRLEMHNTNIENTISSMLLMKNNSGVCEIYNSTLKDNSGSCSITGNFTLENSFLDDVSIHIGNLQRADILNTIIYSNNQNKSGIVIRDYANADILIENCSIIGWQKGLELGNPSSSLQGQPSNFQIINNTISECTTSIHIYTNPQNIDITYNNFYNNTNDPNMGTSYINEDPLFVNQQNKDFHLQYESQLIDAGYPGGAFSNEPKPNGRIVNIGAYGNTAEATKSFETIISQNISEDMEWNESVLIKDNIIIEESVLVTIFDSVYVGALDDKLLTVNGSMQANGGADSIQFNVVAGGLEWLGILIEGSDEISAFNNTTIQNAKNGLYVEESEVELEHCTFRNNDTGFLGDNASGIIENSRFENNNSQGAYFSESQMDVNNSVFENNGGRGIYVQYGSGMSFFGDTVRYNAGMSGDIELKGGVVLYSSSPILRGNEIIENSYNGLLTLSTSDPVMNQKEEGYNLIAGNGEGIEEPEYAEILCMDFSVSKLDYGHNDIIDTRGGWLAYSYDESEHANIRGNYWGITDDIEERLNGFSEFLPIDETANTVGGGNLSEGERMFQRGLDDETSGDFITAISTYDSVIQFYPMEVAAVNALDRKFNCYKSGELNFNTLRNELKNLSKNHTNEDARKKAKNLSISCLLELEQYSEAVSEYDTLVINAQTFVDSLYAETDKALAELKLTGGLLAKIAGNTITPQIYKQAMERSETYRSKTENLLSMRFNSVKQLRGLIPEKFALYQNYPNPFNPVTTIKFDLPKRNDVKLIIYNILGQEVKTLLNETRDSGRFEVNWDGRNNSNVMAASGLYIYRIISNEFTQSKKMLLLR